MKNAVRYLAMALVGMSLMVMSCVSKKKFLASEARVSQLQSDSIAARAQLNDCHVNVKNLNSEKESLLNEYALVQKDLKSLSAESKMTIADQTRRLKNLQDNLQAQKEVMEKLKNSISDALINYKTDELSVYIKDGNVYVSLAEKLLFKSGSDKVDPKGRSALKSLAEVLKDTKDISVMIEGHTDNVPIKTAAFSDNWDLSTARASSIVRIMTTDFGFDPSRIIASGRSQYHPVQTNETVAGKAGNRRTEIILSPDLKEVFNLLYQ